LDLVTPTDLVLSTTGKASREVFEHRSARGEDTTDFLTVGGMGHTASIALGVSLAQPERQVVCLDGDGSVLMHMGCLPSIAAAQPQRFLHVLLNNGAHESVGGQPTVAPAVDFNAVALGCGYQAYEQADSLETLDRAWISLAKVLGPRLLEVRLACGSRSDLGRPTTTPEFNKLSFMRVIGHAA
jgi:phosphonopyruvate decarboxylase